MTPTTADGSPDERPHTPPPPREHQVQLIAALESLGLGDVLLGDTGGSDSANTVASTPDGAVTYQVGLTSSRPTFSRPARPRSAARRERARASTVGGSPASGTCRRHERGRRSASGDRDGRAVPLRTHAPGCYDVDARIEDMDLGGIWANAQLPESGHRLLRFGLRPGARSGSASTRSGRGTTGSSSSGTSRTRIG